jgi:fatty-acyl-CoA synthase
MAPSFVKGPTDPALVDVTISRALADAAKRWGYKEALVVGHQNVRWTWSQLEERVDALARGLLALGFRPGDRLGVWATNRWEWIVTQFATSKLGVILVSINPAYRLAELEYALNKVACKGLVTGDSFKTSDYIAMLNELIPELGRSTPGRIQAKRVPSLSTLIRLGDDRSPGMLNFSEVITLEPGTEDALLSEIEARLSARDAINIQFTSGTTGSPKAATLSHHNVLNNARIISQVCLKLTADDRICVPVPMYHCFGMVGCSLVGVVTGATMVLPTEAFEPGATLHAIENERCTTLYGVPTMFRAMLEHPRFRETDVSSLRTGIMAGAPCPTELMKRAVTDFHLPEITIAYGMTETSPVSFQSRTDDPVDKRCGTVGRIVPHTEAKIVDLDGKTVARGEQGEILTRGYLVMQGYWDDAKATAQAVDDGGWMHTGDLGTLDEEGWLRITGRAKDMIIRGGENAYPREVEEFLYRHPKIRDVQVFGVPHPKWGECVAAWIRLHEGEESSAEEIRAFCTGRIAHYKIPAHIRFVTEFPMTVTGKIQKFVMREQLAKELGVEEQTTA